MTQPLDPLLSPLHIPDTIIVHKPSTSVSPDKIIARTATIAKEINIPKATVKCDKCDKPGHANSNDKLCPEYKPQEKDLKRKKREDEEASIREKYENLIEEAKRLKSRLTETDKEIRKITTVYPFVLNTTKKD
jgi:seryl-tRNA synthetase